MVQKGSRIDDVKRPDKVAPSATSRPILVSNGPTLTTDPMMAPPEAERKDTGSLTQSSHTPKVIAPISDSAKVDDVSGMSESADTQAASVLVSASANQSSNDSKTSPADSTSESTSEGPPPEHRAEAEDEAGGTPRDTDAAISAEGIAEAEAKAKRNQELEAMIASEKYVVPINAVQRKRSHMATLCLFIIAILLTVALIDVIADVGIVKLPSSIPRTHLFSK